MVNSETILASDTIAASAAAGTVAFADLTIDPTIAVATQLTVPQTQTWLLMDVFIQVAADAGTSDPILTFLKDTSFIVAKTPPLSTMLVSNNSRPRPFANKILGYGPVSIIQIQETTTTANDATADSLRFRVIMGIVQADPRGPGRGG